MKVFLIVSVLLLNLISTGLLMVTRSSTDIIGILAVYVLFSVILQAILSFHIWSAINDGKSGINPYVAAGLHFIPILGFLWTLISFGMYPSAYQSYAERHEYSSAFIDSSVFNTYVLAVFISIGLMLIPIIKFFVPLFMVVLYVRVVATACSGVSDLKHYKNDQAAEKIGQFPSSRNPLSIQI